MTFVDGLTLVFVYCKLTGHINWSWWLVYSPFLSVFVFMIIKKIWDYMVD